MNLDTKYKRSEIMKYFAFVPWIFAFVSSVITIYLFVQAFNEYSISYWLTSSDIIPRSTSEYPIEISIGDVTVNSAQHTRISSLTVWNSGRKTISRSDLRSPMRVEFGGCPVRAVRMVAQNNLGENDSFLFSDDSKIDNAYVDVNIENFDPGEAIKIAFISSCPKLDVSVVLISPYLDGASKHPVIIIRLSIILIAIMALVVVISIASMAEQLAERRSSPKWKRYILMALPPIAIVVLTAFVVGDVERFDGVPLTQSGPVTGVY